MFQLYSQDKSYRGELGSGYINSGAEIHVRDGKIVTVDLDDEAIFSDCFEVGYKKQLALKKTMTDDEARRCVQSLETVCPKK